MIMSNSFNFRLTSELDITLMSADFNLSGPGALLFLSLILLICTSPNVIGEMDRLSRRTEVSRFLSMNVFSQLSVVDSFGGHVGFFLFGGSETFFTAKAVRMFHLRLLMFSSSAIIFMKSNSAFRFFSTRTRLSASCPKFSALFHFF